MMKGQPTAEAPNRGRGSFESLASARRRESFCLRGETIESEIWRALFGRAVFVPALERGLVGVVGSLRDRPNENFRPTLERDEGLDIFFECRRGD